MYSDLTFDISIGYFLTAIDFIPFELLDLVLDIIFN